MTKHARAEFIQNFYNLKCVDLLSTKGVEYSRSEEDVNSNFKRLAAETGIDSKTVLFIYLKKHLDAITNYIKQGKVESEPIEDRIADAINYLFILASLIKEEEEDITHICEQTSIMGFRCIKFEGHVLPHSFLDKT